MRKVFVILVWFSWFSNICCADFRVLFCEASCKDKGCRIHVILDSQFVSDLQSVLSEGADYVLELEFKGLNGKFVFKRVLSYDVIDKLYILKEDKKEEKIADPLWFYYKARILDLYVPFEIRDGKKLCVRAVKKNPDLPFPFNLLPIGVFKTSWRECRVEGGS